VRTCDALQHFSNDPYALAAALGISRQAVEQWGERVPELSARQLHDLTGGKLKFEPALYRKGRRSA